MVLPIDHPYPNDNNPVTVRASAALPAAGAWDAAPTVFNCVGKRYVTFCISYTRGAAGGAVDFQLQASPYSATVAGVENWFNQAIYAAGAVAAGADTQSRMQQEYATYASKGAAIENFIYGPVDLGNCVERLRLPCRESGDTNTPGTVHIVAVYAEE